MEIRFKSTYVSEDLHYAVGIVEPVGDYAIRVIDPTHIIMTDPEKWTPGTDPSAIFGITEEEYNWKDTDLEKLDDLAQKLRTDIPKDRLLGEKDGVRSTDRVESIDYGKYTRYRKELNEKRRDMVINNMLNAEELYMMYCGETGKPYVFGFQFILMYEDKTMAMEAANEYRKRNVPLLVSTFTRDQFNKEETKSIFQELQVMGLACIMFIDKEKRQAMLLTRDILKHPAFLGNKNNMIFGNGPLDFALTNLFQYMRTPNLTDRSDPEKFKEAVTKQISFYESRVIESLSEAKYLVPFKVDKDGRASTPIVRFEPKPKQPAEGEAAQPEEGEKLPPKQFLPVFSNGMEFFTDNDSFKARIMSYDDVMTLITEGKLDGFLLNMKSRCALPCTEERFKQVAEFRAWKEKRIAEAKEKGIELPDAPKDEAPVDTPFVPITGGKNEKE
ncbi:MAG: hypothetical protein MJ175_10095 [Clostridia bacterium]|nr:hypothetical protein [Clostridia bacterium]